MLTALSETSTELQLNSQWVMDVVVRDADDELADVSPVVTVTLPNGTTSTPTVETLQAGVYRASVTVASAGRYVATAVATGYGATAFAAYVSGVTAGSGMPDLDDLKAYLGETSTTDAVLQDALDAELAAQRKRCDVPAIFPADLRQAALRRAARNLALRGIPLAVLRGDGEFGSLTPPGRDPEVRRLEGPYKRLVQP